MENNNIVNDIERIVKENKVGGVTVGYVERCAARHLHGECPRDKNMVPAH